MRDWVAFNEQGFPYSFSNADFYTEQEFLDAEVEDHGKIPHLYELVEGEALRRLLKIHHG